MQDCYRGQYLQILSRVRYTLLGSYLRDKDRLLSELNPVWVVINLNMDSYRKIYIVNLIFS